MRRLLWVAAGLVVAAAVAWLAVPLLATVRTPIKVGLLHSLTGPMAISERSMVDAERLAIEEINASGGLLGRKVQAVEADGRSDPEVFAKEAQRLIEVEKVSVIVGCWTSACRKSVKPVVERAGHLLIYPVAYEGLEQSPNIVYTGAAPNQQIIPTVKWCRDALKAKSFFLIGSDSVWPRAAHAIIKDQLHAVGATLAGEEFLEADTSDVAGAIKKAAEAKPDVILTTIEGDSNLPFYMKARGTGAAALSRRIPIVSFSGTEEELSKLPVKEMVNDYLTCNYFQSVARQENEEFIRAFKTRYGEHRVMGDSMATAYSSLRLWAQAVHEAETDEVGVVNKFLLRQSVNAPEGVISVDEVSRHTWRPFFIGRVLKDGQVEIVSAAVKPIRPVPFPFSRTRPEWESFLEQLLVRWNGSWVAPARVRPEGSF